MTSPLDTLVDEFLRAEWEERPQAASAVGIPGYDDRLPDLSAAAFARRASAEDGFATRFAAVPCASADEEIDRDLVLATLRGRALERPWAAWKRNPDTYLVPGLTGVFTLFLHRLAPEPELVAAAAARLRGVPSLLAAGRANLDPELASPVLVRRALGQARAGSAYARRLVAAEATEPSLRAELAAAGAVAADALDTFADFLEDFPARGSYAIGEELYSALLRSREGLAFGARELRTRGEEAYAALAADMSRRTRDLAGHDDWRSLLAELATAHPATPEEMREAYAAWTERARSFVASRSLVTLPDGEECLVEPSPHFQRPVLAVASYVTPPAFRSGRVGHFFVPYPPDGTPPDEVAKRLATNAFHSIPTISVHEAYPGHHWHLSWMIGTARPVRRVLGTSYFIEGWALYAEEMMKEQGFFTDPRDELCQVDARLFRAARIVVDTSLHLGEMSVDEAVAFLCSHASLSEPTARAEVARYCAWPTQAASYLTGSLEIERLRGVFLGRGLGTLRDFHDRIAGAGMLPIALAERATLGS